MSQSLTLTKFRFLYYLILALDANFRLKNRIRSSEAIDPGLMTGLAYFVSQIEYNDHLRQYVTQEDVSEPAKNSFHLDSKSNIRRSAHVVVSRLSPTQKASFQRVCVRPALSPASALVTSLFDRMVLETYRRVNGKLINFFPSTRTMLILY